MKKSYQKPDPQIVQMQLHTLMQQTSPQHKASSPTKAPLEAGTQVVATPANAAVPTTTGTTMNTGKNNQRY